MNLRVLVEVFGRPVLDVRLGGRFAECELWEDATARAGHHVASVTTGLELRTCSEILRLKERKHCVLMLKSSIENRGSTDIKASQPQDRVKRRPRGNESSPKILRITTAAGLQKYLLQAVIQSYS